MMIKVNKILLIILLLIMVKGVVAYTYEYSFINNDYFVSSENISLVLQVNETININYDGWLSGVSLIYFNSSNFSSQIVSIEVPFNYTAGNYTKYVYYNTTLNTTSNISFHFVINQSSQVIFTDLNPSKYVYHYNISEVPISFNQKFNLTLDVEQDYYITDSSWVSITPYFFNETSIKGRLYEVLAQVSVGGSLGYTSQTINVVGSGYSKIIYFDFNVTNSSLVGVTGSEDPTNLTDDELLEYFRSLIFNQTIYQNNTIYVYNTTVNTSVIEVPTNKEAFLDWYNKIDPSRMEWLEGENNRLRNQLNNEEEDKETAQKLNTQLDGRLGSIEEWILKDKNISSSKIRELEIEYSKKRLSIFWWSIGIICVIILGLFFNKISSKHNYPI